MNRRSAMLAAVLLVGPVAAQAIPISFTLDVAATDFTLSHGSGSTTPFDPVLINFSVSFDNAADIAATTTGLTINSFNLPYSAQYAYIAALDILALGPTVAPGGCFFSLDSFCMFIDNASTGPVVVFLAQSVSGQDLWRADSISQSIVSEPVAVPEPGTLSLLLLGAALMAFGLVRRRQRQEIRKMRGSLHELAGAAG